MDHRGELVLTSCLDSSEGLNIHSPVEVFNDLGQVLLGFFDRAVADQSANRSHYNHEHMQISIRRSPTKTSTSDVVACKFRYSLHHLEHSWDNFFQDIRFLTHGFIRNPVRQRQKAMQSVEEAQRYLVIFILFLQELDVKCHLHIRSGRSSVHEPQT